MKMNSPSNVVADIGQTLKPHEYIGMVRREVLDAYLRDRVAAAGATIINVDYKYFTSIDADDYEYTIAFQERIKIPDDKMQYYENLAEMNVGDDVSPDFYEWVLPKCDHVVVGTGTATHKPDIKKFQLATRLRPLDISSAVRSSRWKLTQSQNTHGREDLQKGWRL